MLGVQGRGFRKARQLSGGAKLVEIKRWRMDNDAFRGKKPGCALAHTASIFGVPQATRAKRNTRDLAIFNRFV